MKWDWEIIIVGGLVMLAAITKSAKISSWVSTAMSAPIPVSPLVHSSSLITAEVYLLIRLNIALKRSWIGNLLL